MAGVVLHGHGVFCHACQTVYDSTDGCDHRLRKKDGIQKGRDGYFAQPEDKGHFSPCHYVEIDGMEQCLECGRVKLPEEMMDQ